jgi:hypothetical protein
MSKQLFTTNHVDDSFFMSSDLHINESFKDGLEFHIDGQRDNAYFTLYKEGVRELAEFLNTWLKENE